MLPETILQFDGPPTFACFGSIYVTLTHGGIKAEAEPYPTGLCDSAEEAWVKFGLQLADYTKEASQVAWRRKPALSTHEGKFAVSARLIRYPEEPA